MNSDPWTETLYGYARGNTVASPPAIRMLYYAGHLPDEIAAVTGIPVADMQHALLTAPVTRGEQ